MITGRVASEANPIAGVRVVARDVDPSGSEPAYHTAPDGEVVLAETMTADDGTYRLELPRGWVGLAFEHDAWMRAYRTADTTFLPTKNIDVALSAAPAPREFTMPEAGETEVVLDFASARLHIEPGDLVTLEGEPVAGPVVARVDAPDPMGGARWASDLVASPLGVDSMTTFGLVSVELSSGDEPLKVARRHTLRWEVDIAPQQRDQVLEAWRSGALHNYSLDTRSGLWIRDAARLDVVDGMIVVERSHFSAAATGSVPQPDMDGCTRGYDQTIIGLDSLDISGTADLDDGDYSADVGGNEDVTVRGTSRVEGTASSSAGVVTLTGNAVVTGGTFTGVDTFVAPVPASDFTRVRATNNNAAIASSMSNGGLTLSDTQSVALPAGEYALATLELSGKAKVTCTGEVYIYLGGALKVAGQAVLNADPGCELVIISDSSSGISFTGGSAMSAVIYAPRASIKFAGNGFGLTGAVVGRTVDITGTFDFVAGADAYVSAGVCDPNWVPPSDDEGGDDEDDTTTSGGPEDDSSEGGDDEGDLPELPDLPD